MLSHVVRRNANVCGTKWLQRAAAPQSPTQTTMALQTLLYHTPNSLANWKLLISFSMGVGPPLIVDFLKESR